MIHIEGIPAFSDNYLWCIHNQHDAVIIDPGCAKSVENYLSMHGLNLTAILITHHHPDHIGGVKQLKAKYSPTVYGFKHSNLEFLDRKVCEGDSIQELNLDFSVLEVPGHTLDHIAYFTHIPKQDRDGEPKLEASLFCGDTLFSAGCGRLFEGTPEQMLSSLSKFKALPEHTRVYCAHEYTLNNLAFAKTLMPTNQCLATYTEECRNKRDQDVPTIPTTLKTELAINPFLRETDSEIYQQLHLQGLVKSGAPTEVFRAIRKAKDTF